MSHKINKEMLDPSIFESTGNIGDLSQLETETKDTIVDAINSMVEVRLDNKENRKLLAQSLGEPILETDTIPQICGKIDVIEEKFKAKLTEKGVDVSNVNGYNALVEKIDVLDNIMEGVQEEGVCVFGTQYVALSHPLNSHLIRDYDNTLYRRVKIGGNVDNMIEWIDDNIMSIVDRQAPLENIHWSYEYASAGVHDKKTFAWNAPQNDSNTKPTITMYDFLTKAETTINVNAGKKTARVHTVSVSKNIVHFVGGCTIQSSSTITTTPYNNVEILDLSTNTLTIVPTGTLEDANQIIKGVFNLLENGDELIPYRNKIYRYSKTTNTLTDMTISDTTIYSKLNTVDRYLHHKCVGISTESNLYDITVDGNTVNFKLIDVSIPAKLTGAHFTSNGDLIISDDNNAYKVIFKR